MPIATVGNYGRAISQIILLALAVATVVWALWHIDVDNFVEFTADAGPLPFFAALAVLPAIGFPTTPLFLLAGAAFGAPLALLGTVVSMTLNLGLTYWLAGSYLRRTLEILLLVRFRYSLPNLSRVGAWRFTVLVKLAPGVPTFVKNYLVGIAGVPATIYFAVLWPLTMIYAAAVILLGGSLYDRDQTMTIVAAVALVLLIVGLKILRQRWRRRGESERDEDAVEELAEAEAFDDPDPDDPSETPATEAALHPGSDREA